MRRIDYEMNTADSVAFLQEAPQVIVAGDINGRPVQKVVHGVVHDGSLWFHGAPAGEKTGLTDRDVVVTAFEVLARIPSWFSDPKRACPATTYYRSAQLHGTLTSTSDPEVRAAVLQELMRRFQPEGRHEPITPGHPLYRGPLKNLMIVGVPLDGLAGKLKVGQNLKPGRYDTVLAALWKRGDELDCRAIESMRATRPDHPEPAFLRGIIDASGARITLHCSSSEQDLIRAAALLKPTYWHADIEDASRARVLRSSTACVVARDPQGRLVGYARAVSDQGIRAWVYDVIVDAPYRGRGLGKAIMRTILDHPAVRSCREVALATRDATGLYAQFGFELHTPRSPTSVQMVRRRDSCVAPAFVSPASTPSTGALG